MREDLKTNIRELEMENNGFSSQEVGDCHATHPGITGDGSLPQIRDGIQATEGNKGADDAALDSSAALEQACQAQTGASASAQTNSKRPRDDTRRAGIHPLNVYASKEPDFAALAVNHPTLRGFVRLDRNGRGSIDFRDSNACR